MKEGKRGRNFETLCHLLPRVARNPSESLEFEAQPHKLFSHLRLQRGQFETEQRRIKFLDIFPNGIFRNTKNVSWHASPFRRAHTFDVVRSNLVFYTTFFDEFLQWHFSNVLGKIWKFSTFLPNSSAHASSRLRFWSQRPLFSILSYKYPINFPQFSHNHLIMEFLSIFVQLFSLEIKFLQISSLFCHFSLQIPARFFNSNGGVSTSQ